MSESRSSENDSDDGTQPTALSDLVFSVRDSLTISPFDLSSHIETIPLPTVSPLIVSSIASSTVGDLDSTDDERVEPGYLAGVGDPHPTTVLVPAVYTGSVQGFTGDVSEGRNTEPAVQV